MLKDLKQNGVNTSQRLAMGESKKNSILMQQSITKRIQADQPHLFSTASKEASQSASSIQRGLQTKKSKGTLIKPQSEFEKSEKQLGDGENGQEQKIKKKGIFEEYQERWKKNNSRIFRFLITWKVGDSGKIEDQLKLMITYLSIIFVTILFACGFGTTFYFHMANKQNIHNSITSQAQTILSSGLAQYKNSTEYILKGYEFVLDYLSELVLSKLQISYKIYDFNDIAQFPYKGPGRMRNKNYPNPACVLYTGNAKFDVESSLKCMDYFMFNNNTVPLVDDSVYQEKIDLDELTAAVDILNYVMEGQIFDIYITKMYNFYLGFEYHQAMYGYPGLQFSAIPDDYVMHERPWYENTRTFHINQKDEKVFRVLSTPYYDAGTGDRIVTISKSVLAPSLEDTTKRYLKGKGRFMGVASIDIRLSEFQDLFEDIAFYDTGYLVIVTKEGKLLNEPSQFIVQTGLEGKVYEDLSIQQLLSESDWNNILNSDGQLISEVTTINGDSLVVASIPNSENFYAEQKIIVMIVIPFSEVYGEIDTQNTNNLHNILISSLTSLSVFILATLLCMIYVKKKIVRMVSAITELNKCALSLTNSNNSKENTHSKKEVMDKLFDIQQNSQSETIRELVKGFENQLKGISKLGKGGQNILKNGKNTLKYDQAEYGGTSLPSYIEPLLNYLNVKREKLDSEPSFQMSQYSAAVSQIKTLTNQQKKQTYNPNSFSNQNILTPKNLTVDECSENNKQQHFSSAQQLHDKNMNSFNNINNNGNNKNLLSVNPSPSIKPQNNIFSGIGKQENETIEVDLVSLKLDPTLN